MIRTSISSIPVNGARQIGEHFGELLALVQTRDLDDQLHEGTVRTRGRIAPPPVYRGDEPTRTAFCADERGMSADELRGWTRRRVQPILMLVVLDARGGCDKLAAWRGPEDRPTRRPQGDRGHRRGRRRRRLLAVPAARFVVAPAAGGAAGQVDQDGRARVLSRRGSPSACALVADHRDAWTLEKQVQLGAAWLLREGDAVKAWSTTCPHLGCAVDRSASAPGFYCPCHDSSFDPDGRRLSGPSPARSRCPRDARPGRRRRRGVPAVPAGHAGQDAGRLSHELEREMRVAGRAHGVARRARAWMDHPVVGGAPWASAHRRVRRRRASGCSS